jgi:hypothetical protein
MSLIHICKRLKNWEEIRLDVQENVLGNNKQSRAMYRGSCFVDAIVDRNYFCAKVQEKNIYCICGRCGCFKFLNLEKRLSVQHMHYPSTFVLKFLLIYYCLQSDFILSPLLYAIIPLFLFRSVLSALKLSFIQSSVVCTQIILFTCISLCFIWKMLKQN